MEVSKYCANKLKYERMKEYNISQGYKKDEGLGFYVIQGCTDCPGDIIRRHCWEPHVIDEQIKDITEKL